MKYYKCSYLILIITSLLSFAIPQNAKAQIDSFTPNHILKFNVLESIYTLTFPTLQFAYEYQINNRFSIIPELGFQINDFPRYYLMGPYENKFVKPSGVKALVEGRYYFYEKMKKKSLHRFALGLNCFYRNNKGNQAINYFKDADTSQLLLDEYWYSKNVLGTQLSITSQIVLQKGWTFETNIGMGILKRNVQEFELEYLNDKDKFVPHIHQIFPNPNLSDNNGLKFSFIIGFKFGYAFIRNKIPTSQLN